MNSQLLEIHPMDMEFIFELKKQSTCSVRLTNKTSHTVAFKVKTTSPKKYCVRPNVGIVLPNSTCEFTVTMQAQKVAPPNLICKDKFLIQSTVVPAGITEKDITSVMFSKDDGKNVEEVKLRVIFVSPPQSPVLSPINREIKQAPFLEFPMLKDPVSKRRELLNPPMVSMDASDEEFKMSNGQGFFNTSEGLELEKKNDVTTGNESKLDVKDEDFKMINDQGFFSKTEGLQLKPKNAVTAANELKEDAQDEEFKLINSREVFATTKDLKLQSKKGVAIDNELKPANEAAFSMNEDLVNTEESKLAKDELKPDNITVYDEQLKPVDHCESSPVEDAERNVELREGKAAGDPKLVSDIQEMKLKLNVLELKFNEVESTISKLIEERKLSTHDIQILQQELEVLSRRNVRNVQEGFPLLFVVMIALVSVVLGYFSHS